LSSPYGPHKRRVVCAFRVDAFVGLLYSTIAVVVFIVHEPELLELDGGKVNSNHLTSRTIPREKGSKGGDP